MNRTLQSARALALFAGGLAGGMGAWSAQAQSLSTTFTSNNGLAGNTFDLTPTWPATVTGWATNLTNVGTINTITAYTRAGTAAGFAGTAAGWTVRGRDAGVISLGQDIRTPVRYCGLELRPGKTTGVYWDLSTFVFGGTALRYTNGVPTAYANGELALISRDGASSPAFISVVADRIWNGTVTTVPTASAIQNATFFAGGNGNAGVTFNVMPERDVTLTSLGVNLDPGTYAVSVYYRAGQAQGFENTASAWTLIGTDPNVVSVAAGAATRVNVGGVTLRRGQVYGFYVDANVPQVAVRYTDGIATFQGKDVRIASNAGHGTGFTGINPNRIFNGSLETVPTATIRRLATTMAGGNQQDGVMFDIVSTRAIDVTGFDVNIIGAIDAAQPFQVFYRVGSSVGAESSSLGWIFAGSDTDVRCNGIGNATPIQFGRVSLSAGQTYGFFITGTVAAAASPIVEYTSGTNSYSDGTVTLTSNCGKQLPTFTGSTFFPRTFNGRLKYTLSDCYANCDGSTTAPVLGAADFGCFLAKYRAGDAYANCDLSTVSPVLGAADFSCFLASYRAGCP